MALVNRLLDKVGSGLQRTADDRDAEIARLRDDQRLLESALKRALVELAQLRDEVSALRAAPSVAPMLPPVPPPPRSVTRHAATEVPKATKVATGFMEGARQASEPAPPQGEQVATVENESVLAKASGLRLTIDRNECIGCGTCVEHEEGVFHLNDGEGKAYVVRQEGLMDGIQDAIDACPVTCISWKPPELAAD
jgi:ferredoxin